jgi:hypothetical protein
MRPELLTSRWCGLILSSNPAPYLNRLANSLFDGLA